MWLDDLSLGGAMKSIIVFRHAAPDDAGDGISDRYGVPQADRLGQQIRHAVQFSSCAIFTSPVLRAKQTAARVALAIGRPVPVRDVVCLVHDNARHQSEIISLVDEAWKEYDTVILSTHHPLTSTITRLFFGGIYGGRWPSSRARDLQAFMYAEGLHFAENFFIRFRP